VFVLMAGCYADREFADTVFKCDQQNGCADGFFCNNPNGGVCVKTGVTGCKGQTMSSYWGFDSEVETDASGWIKSPSQIAPIEVAATFGFAHSVEAFAGTGSMQVTLSGEDDGLNVPRGWIYIPRPTGDGTHRVFSGSIMTPDAEVTVKVNADEEAGFVSQFGTPVPLPRNEWKCVGMDLDAPPDREPGDSYSPARLRSLRSRTVARPTSSRSCGRG
jgi:hypothetical protein